MNRKESDAWIAARRAERERKLNEQKQALWRERVERLMNNDYTIKMQYQGWNVEVTTQLKKPEELDQWLKDMQDAGYTKPTYGKGEKQDIPDGQGKVMAVNASTRKYNGKPLWDVVVQQADGRQYTYQKFNKNEFRAGDDVWCSLNDKGYPDISLDFPEGQKPIPF